MCLLLSIFCQIICFDFSLPVCFCLFLSITVCFILFSVSFCVSQMVYFFFVCTCVFASVYVCQNLSFYPLYLSVSVCDRPMMCLIFPFTLSTSDYIPSNSMTLSPLFCLLLSMSLEKKIFIFCPFSQSSVCGRQFFFLSFISHLSSVIYYLRPSKNLSPLLSMFPVISGTLSPHFRLFILLLSKRERNGRPSPSDISIFGSV